MQANGRQPQRAPDGAPVHYERHRPEQTTPYRLVQQHAASFIAHTEASTGSELPRFIKEEFDAYLECGILAHGSLRLRCGECGHDNLLACSCKRRGFCPSCGARRMSQTAAHLMDHVIPHVPVRQWVLSLPIPLRVLLAAQPELVAPVLQGVVMRHLLDAAGLTADEGLGGAVTLIQRFGSAANLNIHLHCLVLDGVYCCGTDDAPTLVEVGTPTDEELHALLRNVIARLMKLFTRRGVLVEDMGQTYLAEPDADGEGARTLRPLQAAAITLLAFAWNLESTNKGLTTESDVTVHSLSVGGRQRLNLNRLLESEATNDCRRTNCAVGTAACLAAPSARPLCCIGSSGQTHSAHRMRARSRPRLWVQTLARLFAASALLAPRLSSAEPLESFPDALPQAQAATAASALPAELAWGVGATSGTATYAYTIALPVGRQGMAPKLSLQYSSNVAIAGTLAAGWTLQIPNIAVERTQRREGTNRALYVANLRHRTGRLIEVPESSPFGGTAYRIEYDDSYARVYRLNTIPARWAVQFADGTTAHFGEQPAAGDRLRKWNITREIDRFGNEIRYNWSAVSHNRYSGYQLRRIEYSANPGANLLPHARVDFTYGPIRPCGLAGVPIGAAATSSTVMEWPARLESLQVSVRDEQSAPFRAVSTHTFEYREHNAQVTEVAPGFATSGTPTPRPRANGSDCVQRPIRYLTAIANSATNRHGVRSEGPRHTFDYNWRRSAATIRERCLPTLNCSRHIRGAAHLLSGDRRGALQSVVDVDHDGIPDSVRVLLRTQTCMVSWRKGLLDGSYETNEQSFALPTASWQPGGPGADDRCTFNGQYFTRHGSVIAADLPGGRSAGSAGTSPKSGSAIRYGYLAYAWGDVHGNGAPALTTVLSDPGNDFLLSSNDAGPWFEPESPWLIHTIAGSGSAVRLLGSRRIVRQQAPAYSVSPGPIAAYPSLRPLPKATYQIPTTVDLDGDGTPDRLVLERSHRGRAEDSRLPFIVRGQNDGWDCPRDVKTFWLVQRNLAESLSPLLDERCWPVPDPRLAVPDTTIVASSASRQSEQQHTNALLFDVNGDGLPDLVVQLQTGDLVAYLNTGGAFATTSSPLGVRGPVEIVQTDRPKACADECSAARGYRRRLLDIDGDGLLDLVTFSGRVDDIRETSDIRVSFNLGGHFGPQRKLASKSWARAKQLMLQDSSGRWALRHDRIHVPSEVHPVLAEWNEAGDELLYELDPALGSASDLLSSVSNGRGAAVRFRYAARSDPNAVAGGVLPGLRNGWAVVAAEVQPGLGQAAMMTSYRFGGPELQRSVDSSNPKPLVFLGYRGVEITRWRTGGQIASRSQSKYIFLAPEGRLQEQRTYVQSGSELALAHAITWKHSARPLYGGKLSVILEDSRVSRTCSLQESEAACMEREHDVEVYAHSYAQADTAAPPSAICEALHPVSSVGMHLRTSTTSADGLKETSLRKRHAWCYELRTSQGNASNYLILRTSHEITSLLDATEQISGRERYEFDNLGLPRITSVWADSDRVARTIREFDNMTGNLISVTKPEQASPLGTGVKTIFDYGSNRLTPTRIRNELGQTVMAETDTATGRLTLSRGPNYFLDDAGQKILQESQTEIDGFGRIVGQSIVVPGPQMQRTVRRIARNRYLDSSIPNRVVRERLVDSQQGLWKTEEATLDGLGRVIAVREKGSEQAMFGQPTKIQYGDLGEVQELQLPDPRPTASLSTVDYKIAVDGLGRTQRVLRPNGTGQAFQYDGQTTTARDIAADGTGAMTRHRRDAFGQLVETRTSTLDGSISALVRYHYDARGRLVRFQDADRNSVSLEWNWQGQRTKLTRQGRTWNYQYDLNGNLLRRSSPAIGSPAVARYSYDDLDRVRSVTVDDVDIPGLSAGTATAVLASATTLHYDRDSTSVGRLSSVTLPIGEVEYHYNILGRLRRETRRLRPPTSPGVEVTAAVDLTYNDLGQLVGTALDSGQYWRNGYDGRGRLQRVEWSSGPGQTLRTLFVGERDDSGLLRRQGTDSGFSRTFAYDALRRPVVDTVLAPDGTELLRRHTQYWDSGNVREVEQLYAGVRNVTSYDYDYLDRVTSARSSDGNEYHYAYGATGNVLHVREREAASSQWRHLIYRYGAVDRDAVDQIVDDTGETVADYSYGASGSTLRRVVAGKESRFAYDALEQLRFADGAGYSESYHYDHVGNRVLAVRRDGTLELTMGGLLRVYDSGGAVIREVTYPSAHGTPLARVDNAGIDLQYFDAVGTLLLEIPSRQGGALVPRFGPFGEQIGVDPRPGSAHNGFNGKATEEATGLRYYGRRYYDPASRRWTSADPVFLHFPEASLGATQAANLYSFSLNNALKYVDPDGALAVWEPPSGDLGRQEDQPVRFGINLEMIREACRLAGGSLAVCKELTIKTPQIWREGDSPQQTEKADVDAAQREVDEIPKHLAELERLRARIPGVLDRLQLDGWEIASGGAGVIGGAVGVVKGVKERSLAKVGAGFVGIGTGIKKLLWDSWEEDGEARTQSQFLSIEIDQVARKLHGRLMEASGTVAGGSTSKQQEIYRGAVEKAIYFLRHPPPEPVLPTLRPYP